jgi:hypothetical protein
VPSKVWDRDPIAFAIQNKLAIFFDNFPQGASRGPEIHERIVESFNRSLCSVGASDGRLVSTGEYRLNIVGDLR